jgi:hypothetical protein
MSHTAPTPPEKTQPRRTAEPRPREGPGRGWTKDGPRERDLRLSRRFPPPRIRRGDFVLMILARQDFTLMSSSSDGRPGIRPRRKNTVRRGRRLWRSLARKVCQFGISRARGPIRNIETAGDGHARGVSCGVGDPQRGGGAHDQILRLGQPPDRDKSYSPLTEAAMHRDPRQGDKYLACTSSSVVVSRPRCGAGWEVCLAIGYTPGRPGDVTHDQRAEESQAIKNHQSGLDSRRLLRHARRCREASWACLPASRLASRSLSLSSCIDREEMARSRVS